MAWKFRRRVKIIPGVHLNFSKTGISTSIGIKGMGMTFGSSGTYLNTSIPGLGIYNREKLSNKPERSPLRPVLKPYDTHQFDTSGSIFSSDIHNITTQDMQGIKEAIILARQQRTTLREDLLAIQRVLQASKMKKTLSYLFLYGLVKKSIPQRLSNDIITHQEAIEQTQEQLEASFVKLEVDFDPYIKQKYDTFVAAFTALCGSSKIWDVTSSRYEDTVVSRSPAGTVITRRKVDFGLKSLSEFNSGVQGLYFQNANGADLYIYPSFIIMYASTGDFAIIGLEEITLECQQVRFTETEQIPSDAEIIDHTWAKVNKNGTPDRRFTGNYQIPVALYGEIILRTNTGLNEIFMLSNYKAVHVFGEAFKEYRKSLMGLTK
ncbi:MAG: DUF4236 domain-containing protein [Sphingobacterium sp.]